MTEVFFQPIHPVIPDLYINILKLGEMGSVIDGYNGPAPPELYVMLQRSSDEFISKEMEALDILKSRHIVEQQLFIFHERLGKT
jgi:hypothetical protein